MRWDRRRLDWLATEERATVDPTEITADTVFHYSIPALDEFGDGRLESPDEIGSGKLLLSGGEILISKLNPRLPRVLLAEVHDVPTVASTEFIALRPGPNVDERFLRYWLASEPLRQLLNSATMSATRSQQRVRPEIVTKSWLWIPSVEEQRAIADYLDRETARIDALIEKKRRMIELLEEQTHAWSVRLVLGDLGGKKGSTSPSGLYRVVPDGWKETALRHLHCSVQTGPFGSQLHAEEYVEGGWPVVNPMNLVEGEISAVETMTISDQKRTELARHILAPGDIVFGRRGEMGRAGLAEEAHRGWLCGTGSLRLRLRSTLITPTYLKLLLETPVARAYFELASVGSTMDNLNSEIVLALPTLVPPIATQDRIVKDVYARRETTEALRGRLERQIGLLQEHRQALITAAVTGHLEIPVVAA